MKKGKNKRLLPLALCLCMLLTALPMTGGVLAGELPGAQEGQLLGGEASDTLYTIDDAADWNGLQDWLKNTAASNAVVKINIAGWVDKEINVLNKNIKVEGPANGTIEKLRIISTGAVVLTIKNLNLSTDNVDGVIELFDGSTLNFEGENTLTVYNADAPVIHVPEGRKLTLTGVGTDPTLAINATLMSAGIGGKGSGSGDGESAGDVNITDGEITINTRVGTGIGGGGGPSGNGGNGGNVTITDAKVTINAKDGLAIGSGFPASPDNNGTLAIDSTDANRTVLDMKSQGTNATIKYSIGTCQINDSTGVLTGYYSKLTVTDGMADSSDQQKDFWKSGIFKSGATVNLTADKPPQNKYFTGWTANPALTFDDSKAMTTTFTMPQTAQEVTANFAQETAPTITGQQEKEVSYGYESFSTDAYTLTGGPAPAVTLDKDYGGKITWNETDSKLEIAAGLQGGTYPVVLTASNGVGPDASLTFTLTVLSPPSITGEREKNVPYGYEAFSTDAYTLTGGPAPAVTLDEDYGGKITWNETDSKLEVAAGLEAGTYPVVLTASNGIEPDASLTFTLTVSAPKTPTGDESALWPWALLMLAAGAGIAAAIYRRRNKTQYRHR